MVALTHAVKLLKRGTGEKLFSKSFSPDASPFYSKETISSWISSIER